MTTYESYIRDNYNSERKRWMQLTLSIISIYLTTDKFWNANNINYTNTYVRCVGAVSRTNTPYDVTRKKENQNND